MSGALVLLSGGQDSITCLFWARQKFPRVEALSFDYGQRHKVELTLAREVCNREGITHHVIKFPALGQIAPSALTDTSRSVDSDGGPHGLPTSFVPGRNILFLTIAAAYGNPRGLNDLVIGAGEVDFSGYPDCREEFLASMEKSLGLGLDADLRVHRPLVKLSKAEIFSLAEKLGALDDVLERSHTCYMGDRSERHEWGYGCGQCPACRLRKKGYEEFIAGRVARAPEVSV